jgi:hypothetical protein
MYMAKVKNLGFKDLHKEYGHGDKHKDKVIFSLVPPHGIISPLFCFVLFLLQPLVYLYYLSMFRITSHICLACSHFLIYIYIFKPG